MDMDFEMMEVAEVEPILLKENSKAIAEHESALNAKVNQAMRLLNEVEKVYPLTDGLQSFPRDINELILKLHLQRSKIARDVNSVMPFPKSLQGVPIPTDLQEMKQALEAWKNFQHQDSSEYLLHDGSGWRINTTMIEKEMDGVRERNRTYARTADQVRWYGHSSAVLNITLDYVKHSGIDVSQDTITGSMLRRQLLSPFISWRSFPDNCYTLNYDYILTGKIERK